MEQQEPLGAGAEAELAGCAAGARLRTGAILRHGPEGTPPAAPPDSDVRLERPGAAHPLDGVLLDRVRAVELSGLGPATAWSPRAT